MSNVGYVLTKISVTLYAGGIVFQTLIRLGLELYHGANQDRLPADSLWATFAEINSSTSR